MAYDSLEQHDCDVEGDGDLDSGHITSKNSPAPNTSLHQPTATNVAVKALRQIVHPSNRARSQTDSSYEMVEDDDYDEVEVDDTEALENDDDPTITTPNRFALQDKSQNKEADKEENTTSQAHDALRDGSSKAIRLPILRTAVPANHLDLRHPTPVDDQRVLMASYTDKIELLERTAERLSMTSSIDDAIRDLHGELKRNGSRRSPLRSSPDVTISTRAGNTSQTIEIDTNITSTTRKRELVEQLPSAIPGVARSTSKSSRFGTRPEPELEGRPLDSFSFVQSSSSPPPAMAQSPISQSPIEATGPKENFLPVDRKLEVRNPEPRGEEDRPSSPSSTDTLDAEKMFAGFDGAHAPAPPEPQQRRITIHEPLDALGVSPQRSSFGALLMVDGIDSNVQQPAKDRFSVAGNLRPRQPRISTAERMSMARSQSYEDPETGQQMLYYPAPVPVMLNLPQKLSKAPSSIARSKRRTQALSAIPEPARHAAIWLPDVLEIENEPDLPENDDVQQLEYVPQHQRMSMGGRRVTQDAQHLPPQLRATAFFDMPMPEQVVELKEQSAVATLDSILDASAHAPVTAFTDHLIAGHLGAEVYGQPKMQNRSSTANLLSPEEKAQPKKRTSAFNLLGRRSSGGNALDTETEKRRAEMIADIRAGKIIRDEEEEEEEDVSEPEEEPEEEEYHGAPTTLLAELQLRKQQQKHRTRPLATAYPNGLHSTLLELDAVAQAEAETRKHKRVTLAWEERAAESNDEEEEDDDDVPLALIYAKNAKKAQSLDLNRPLGLIERRDMEDNEPLSRRRDRLQGKIPMNRASLLSVNPPPPPTPPEDEGETLAERLARLRGADGEEVPTDLPKARPVSGDFASEMLSQFGGDLLDEDTKSKGKQSPTDEEEETLGQRRKRLQAEAQARAAEVGASGPAPAAESPSRPTVIQRHSMADILHHHPQVGASLQPKPQTGLLGLNERMGAPKPVPGSTYNNLSSKAPAGGFKGGMYNDGQAGMAPRIPRQHNPFDTRAAGIPQGQFQFPQPSLGLGQMGYNANNPLIFAGGYQGVGGYAQGMGYPAPMQIAYLPQVQNTMASMGMLNMGMGMTAQPLNQGQIDMVERWRQSVMQ